MKEETAPELSKSGRVMKAQKEKGSSKNEGGIKVGKSKVSKFVVSRGYSGRGLWQRSPPHQGKNRESPSCRFGVSPVEREENQPGCREVCLEATT